MKKLIVTIAILAFAVSTGCAATARKQAYSNYINAKMAQVQVERKPILEMVFTEDGRIEALNMYQEPEIIDIQQENDHPVWKFANNLVDRAGNATGVAVIAEATGSAVSSISKALKKEPSQDTNITEIYQIAEEEESEEEGSEEEENEEEENEEEETE